MREGQEEFKSMPSHLEWSGTVNQVMDFGQETLLFRKLAHVVLDFECIDEIYKGSEDNQKTEWKQSWKIGPGV